MPKITAKMMLGFWRRVIRSKTKKGTETFPAPVIGMKYR